MKRSAGPVVLALLALLAFALPAAAEDSPALDQVGTILLSAPVLFKTAAPVGLAVGSLMGDGNYEPAAVLAAIWSVPNAFLLYNIAKGDAKGIRVWRTVNLIVDAATCAALVGLGAWTLAQPSQGGENWGSLVGALAIVVSLPFGVSAGIDAVPFPAERAQTGALASPRP
jgi:hypothetical protein